ncbi:hypothetical protein ABAC460_05100 [Asticcacaulis sp. AC460]|uniref:M23 family metallopeptidase n=1 Tax=Asticcacaulis sp. AC460 TaxID=1282360 RepID=UPI0003C3ED6C|nr:M23 family metallopeptidase [Asticcacaulis sp. AC460]ESQ91718.1 hypothetical protein ABAC460_05100 [Asticcacaulis sp. AC460]
MTAHAKRTHTALAAAVTGLVMLGLQACATTDMPEPKYPVYMQDKPAPAAPVAEAPAPDVVPETLPGPSTAMTTTELPPVVVPPPPPRPDEDMTKPVTTTAAAAPVKDSRAAYSYTLVAQDTLYGISRRFGVPVKTLYDINGFDPGATLRIGQKVLLPEGAADKGPEARANGATLVRLGSAPAAAPKATVTAPAAKPVEAKAEVKPSTSLPPPPLPKPKTTTTTTAPAPAVVAKPTVNPPAATTTAAADVKPAVKAPPVATPTVAVAPVKTPVVTPPAAKPETKPATKPLSATPPPPVAGFPTNAQLTQMGKGMFAWPVKGKILVPFGQLAPNVRNDGINISSAGGTNVLAAADGVVVYQGDQVRELGNTIYIKHPNGWYTGYSHLSGMNVSNNQRVTKGQVIGTVGQSGTIDQPQLHFEVRYTPSTDIARPIDPKLVLPGS